MRVIKLAVVGSMILPVAALLCLGCGEPEYSQPQEIRLEIAALYPQDGEQGVPLNMTAIVVFDKAVTFDSGTANVNLLTFYLEKDGVRVTPATVEKSDLDTQGATALIILPDGSPLESGAIYYVVVEATIQATTILGEDMKPLDMKPLGTQVRNKFTVQ